MEAEPDYYQNVVFIDEYPHLTDRRRVKQALGQLTLFVNHPDGQLLIFPDQPPTPSGEAAAELQP